ncbi:SulP family inorganic anion transporter [Stackebrandtia soli]|uniref:SulP family inorganic anion transporter n=1 Tax=Stackebrandtia soli TaxID=1892856 RepID=UPI0039E7D392
MTSTRDRSRRFGWSRTDLVAGLTVWAVLVPEALAYATIAGVPPVVGLYAAVPALVLYALVGSSRQLVVGPMSATAALSAATIGGLAASSGDRYVALTVALALATGVVGMLAGLLRFGFIANLISAPVLKGFIIGLALTIIAGQLPALLGVDKSEGGFFAQVGGVVASLGDVNGWAVAIGATCLAVVLGLKRWLPVVPGSLVAAVLGITAVAVIGLEHTVDIVGHIDSGLPQLGMPSGVDLGDYLGLAGPAVGVLLVGFAEGLGAAKTYAVKEGYEVSADRELLGLGAANLGSGLASGMVVNGSLSKTAVNGGAGAKSQLSGLIVAALTVITLLFLTGLFERLPDAALAAIVIAAVIELVDVAALRGLYRTYTARLGRIYGPAARTDFAAAIVALLGVLVLGTLPGLFLGIAVSLLLLLYRASRPHVATLGRVGGVWVDVAEHPDATTEPGIVVARLESGLFFANAEHTRQGLRALVRDDTTALVLDGRAMPFIDVTGAAMLTELAKQLRDNGTGLYLAREIGQVRDVLNTGQADADITVHRTVEAAIVAARADGGPERTDAT